MQDAITKLNDAIAAAQAASAELSTPAEPSVGDKALEALKPVLTEAGWTEPATVTNIEVQNGDPNQPASDTSTQN